MAEHKKKRKFQTTKFYSRGPSGKTLPEKYPTERLVITRIKRLRDMIEDAKKKIRQVERRKASKYAELQRLKLLAQEKGYDEASEMLAKTPFPKPVPVDTSAYEGQDTDDTPINQLIPP